MNSRLFLLAYGEMGPHALKGLSENFDITQVVTPPLDTRFRTAAVEETERLASEKDIPLTRDTGLKGLHKEIESVNPDGVVICSYDKIIPQRTLDLGNKFINVHHGDLPRYRGRANLNWAIINGRHHVGLTIHEVVPNLDEGGIYKIWDIPIRDEAYISDIYSMVNGRIRKDLPGVVKGVMDGSIIPQKQKGTPTYCCTRLPMDGRINWYEPAPNVRNLIRGISKPFPGAFSSILDENGGEKGRITIWRADIPNDPRRYEGNIPGRVGRIFRGRGVEVLTGSHPLIVTDVQYNGKECRADEVIKSTATTLR